MINNRGKNFLYKSYIFEIQKSLNNMFLELKSLKSTCSISADFINQFLIYQRVAEKIAKITASCTNFRPVFDISSKIAQKRCEVLKDVERIKLFCGNFKNCPAGTKNYKTEFKKICDDYQNILKDSQNCRNINIFFLKFMIKYNDFSILLNKNALKYRLCPQLRLISEYCIQLGKKENVIMEDVLNSIK